MGFKFEVDGKGEEYSLIVNGEMMFKSKKLSDVVRKIEAHLKLRYLPEPVKLTMMERFQGVIKNVSN